MLLARRLPLCNVGCTEDVDGWPAARLVRAAARTRKAVSSIARQPGVTPWQSMCGRVVLLQAASPGCVPCTRARPWALTCCPAPGSTSAAHHHPGPVLGYVPLNPEL